MGNYINIVKAAIESEEFKVENKAEVLEKMDKPNNNIADIYTKNYIESLFYRSIGLVDAKHKLFGKTEDIKKKYSELKKNTAQLSDELDFAYAVINYNDKSLDKNLKKLVDDVVGSAAGPAKEDEKRVDRKKTPSSAASAGNKEAKTAEAKNVLKNIGDFLFGIVTLGLVRPHKSEKPAEKPALQMRDLEKKREKNMPEEKQVETLPAENIKRTKPAAAKPSSTETSPAAPGAAASPAPATAPEGKNISIGGKFGKKEWDVFKKDKNFSLDKFNENEFKIIEAAYDFGGKGKNENVTFEKKWQENQGNFINIKITIKKPQSGNDVKGDYVEYNATRLEEEKEYDGQYNRPWTNTNGTQFNSFTKIYKTIRKEEINKVFRVYTAANGARDVVVTKENIENLSGEKK